MCKASIIDNQIILNPVFIRLTSSDVIYGPFSFLVDTGATNTTLNYTSAIDEMGISMESPEIEEFPLLSASGKARCYRLKETVEIIFRKTVVGGWEIHSEIMPSIDIFPELAQEPPNLLGMDILSRFDMITDNMNKTMTLKRLEILIDQ